MSFPRYLHFFNSYQLQVKNASRELLRVPNLMNGGLLAPPIF